MLFTSLNFLVFFLLTTSIYYLIPQKFRWILLLTASLVFYLFSFPAYTIVLVGSILLNYGWGFWIDYYEMISKRKQIMILGIVLNLLLLAVFRYADSLFALISAHSHLSHAGNPVLLKIIIPLGISFYTFTNISYLIEIKRKRLSVEKHLGYFACYVSFFPKLIQGPIERPQHFLPQFRENHSFDYSLATEGIRLMLWGFFKKLVVADQLSTLVNPVFDNPLNWHGPLLVLATLLYAFQIYMDFSGYIDIARGAANVLGFRLSRNFNTPYLSRSIKEFWSRWHITLSQWLRDYIFLPFAYYLSARMKKEKYTGISTEKYIYSIAISVTFLLCGLWHGVGWNFIAWGGLFAVYLVIGSFTEKPKKHFYRKIGFIVHKRTYNTLQVIITFLLVCFAWIFFRAADLGSAIQIVFRLFSGWSHDSMIAALHSLQNIFVYNWLNFLEAVFILVMIPCIVFAENYFQHHKSGGIFFSMPRVVRWGTYYLLILLIFYFGKTETNTFIYFQF